MERLTPHRIALRAFVLGPAGGLGALLAFTVGVLLIELAQGRGGPSIDKFLLATLLVWVVCAVWCGVLVGTAEVARFAKGWPLRALILVAIGCLMLVVVVGTGVWMENLIKGRGAEQGWSRIIGLLDRVVLTKEFFFGNLAQLTPFLTLGLIRTAPEGYLSFSGGLICAGAGGLAMFAFIALGVDVPNSREFFGLLVMFVAAPTLAAVGFHYGERLEAKILAWWAERLKQQD